jgi:hypothetical protein
MWRRCHGQAHCQIAPLNEARHASLDGAAVQQDVPVALAAAQSKVCAEAVDEPFPTPTGVGSSQIHHVAEPKLDDTWLIWRH